MGDRSGVRISGILRRMRVMVDQSTDKRATALAELKEQEEGDPFKVLIGTILSHRTRDENTARATENLFSVYKTPRELAAARESTVRRLVRPSGYYNVKAKSVIRASRQIVEEFGGKVPDNLSLIHI